jgi:SET domain-containing protein
VKHKLSRSPQDNAKCVLRRTRRFGQAVFARAKIGAGEVVAVFDGPIYDNDFDDWTDDLLNHAIQFGPSVWRDSLGLARYLNHSCEPNCGIKDYFSLVAMRDIPEGEQLTWDYEMTERSSWWRMTCQCGSKLCRRKIGNYRHLPQAQRKKYAGFISEWLISKTKRKVTSP